MKQVPCPACGKREIPYSEPFCDLCWTVMKRMRELFGDADAEEAAMINAAFDARDARVKQAREEGEGER